MNRIGTFPSEGEVNRPHLRVDGLTDADAVALLGRLCPLHEARPEDETLGRCITALYGITWTPSLWDDLIGRVWGIIREERDTALRQALLRSMADLESIRDRYVAPALQGVES